MSVTGSQNFGALLGTRIQGRRFNNPLEAAGEVLDAAIDLLRENLPPKDDVLKGVAYVYDRFVAPIDIRFIPNIIEPMVDAQLRDYLIKAVDAAYDRFFAHAGN